MAMKIYGWSAPKLADAYTLEELNALRLEVENAPGNKNPVDADGHPINTIWIFTKPARKKLDAIAQAITFRLKEARLARDSGNARHHSTQQMAKDPCDKYWWTSRYHAQQEASRRVGMTGDNYQAVQDPSGKCPGWAVEDLGWETPAHATMKVPAKLRIGGTAIYVGSNAGPIRTGDRVRVIRIIGTAARIIPATAAASSKKAMLAAFERGGIGVSTDFLIPV